MAARLNPSHDARTRAKIQTSQLVNRLHKFVNGEIEMPPHAVTAALGLLKKALPDLQSVQHTGDAENPVHHAVTEIVRKVVDPRAT
jgi:hypothetical protein